MIRLRSRLLARAIFVTVLFSGFALAQDAEVIPERKPQRDHKSVEDRGGSSLLTGIVVNNNGDATDIAPGDGVCETAAGNGICTLRAAVVEANVLAGDDSITFAPAITSISVNGQIAITSNLAINGNGPSALTIQNVAAVSTTSRIFNVTNFTVTLNGLTITGGNLTGSGGAINNTGTLTITNCVITDNDASGAGGGIRSTNSLTINNSVISNNSSLASTSGGISFAGINLTLSDTTIRGNTSMGNGGGMNVAASGSASITNTTISGNTAGASSGGLFLNRGTILNTTISGNTANGSLATEGGGGVRIQAGVNSVTFVACTITGNTAPNSTAGARSGIWHETGTLTIRNSIVAANVAQDIQRDGAAILTSGGFNLIGENTSVTTEFPEGLPNGTNYVGTDAMPLDPMIGPLAYNRGPTFTHALLNGSVAIDKGSSSGLMVDQRNHVRPIDLPGTTNAPGGDGADIGAFESESMPFLEVSIAGRVTDAAGSGIAKALVVVTDAGGGERYALTSSFGFYRLDGIGSGESYIVSVQRKGYLFNPQTVFAIDAITVLDFIAEP